MEDIKMIDISKAIIAALLAVALTVGCGTAFPDDDGDIPDMTSETRQDLLREGKTILTMAAYSAHYYSEDANKIVAREIEDAVNSFNNKNPDYYIELTEYSQFNDGEGSTAGLTKLLTEFNAGKIPDIMEVSGIPFKLYAQRGMFTDLYPFIDADAEYSRSDFPLINLRSMMFCTKK